MRFADCDIFSKLGNSKLSVGSTMSNSEEVDADGSTPCAGYFANEVSVIVGFDGVDAVLLQATPVTVN